MDITEKYTNPTRYDLGRYGEVAKHGDDYFIQVSKNPETAHWLAMGDFLNAVLAGSDLNDDFIAECLELYEKKLTKSSEKDAHE